MPGTLSLPPLEKGRSSARHGPETGSSSLDGGKGPDRGLPAAGTPSRLAGTYMAEQRAADSYDLWSICTPRDNRNNSNGGKAEEGNTPSGNSGSPSASKMSGKRKRRGLGMAETKVTVLPALTSLDVLLARLPNQDGQYMPSPQELDEEMELSKAPEGQGHGASRSEMAMQVVSRLYPGRTGEGEMASVDAPTDEEFMSWLQLPSSTLSLAGSRKSAANSRLLGRAPSAQESSPKQQLHAQSINDSEASALAEAPREGKNLWRLLLLRSSFEDDDDSHPDSVALLLEQVLQIDRETARQHVTTAQKRLMAVIFSHEDCATTFEKVQVLRSFGLVVQVSSPFGPAHQEMEEARVMPESYTELFRRTLKNTDFAARKRRDLPPLLLSTKSTRSSLGESMQPIPSVGSSKRRGSNFRGRPHRAASIRWKADGLCKSMKTLSQDPVKAVLEEQGSLLPGHQRRPSTGFDDAGEDREDSAGAMVPSGTNTGAAGGGGAGGAGGAGRLAGLLGQGGTAGEEGGKKHTSLKSMLSKHRNVLRADVQSLPPVSTTTTTTKKTESQEDQAQSKPGQDEKPAQVSHSVGAIGGLRLLSIVEEASGNTKAPEMTPDRKEAGQIFRFFVYGVTPDTVKGPKEKEQAFTETVPQRDKVQTLYKLWSRLDDDGSGRVDIGEFREFATQHLKDRIEEVNKANVWNCMPPCLPQPRDAADLRRSIVKLCERLVHLLLSRKSSFTLEDMIKVIWPSALVSDVREMKKWCKDFSRSVDRQRVKTPPILPDSEFDGLRSVFYYVDEDGSGSVAMDELVSKGLIYEDQVGQYRAEWDANGDGILDLYEFCDMMCPCGYRAYEGSLVGSSLDGTRLVYDQQMGCWRTRDTVEATAGHTAAPPPALPVAA